MEFDFAVSVALKISIFLNLLKNISKTLVDNSNSVQVSEVETQMISYL